MKYMIRQQVDAIYDKDVTGSPLLAALPDVMSREEFLREIACCPPIPQDSAKLSMTERRRLLSTIPSVFIPMDHMYFVYEQITRLMRTTYTTRTSMDSVRRINALFAKPEGGAFATQAESAALLGTPGVGKSSLVRRCLTLMPQVIEHAEYRGQPFFCKQVTYLMVECPSDCSTKTLSYNIALALDRAIGSNYVERMSRLRSVAASSAAAFVKMLCLTHNVGVLLIDEVQNLVQTAKRTAGVKPLIRFLVELTNDTSTAIYFVGTIDAGEAFAAEAHLRRRTTGLRLLPMRPGGVYRRFVETLWPYQFTMEKAVLTDQMANQIFDYSGGIPAYIVQLFQEAQSQALMSGESAINGKLLRQAVDILNLSPPKKLGKGTSLSDFRFEDGVYAIVGGEEKETARSYANQRGRRATVRDEHDLLIWHKDNLLRAKLEENAMLEVRKRC